MALDPGSQTQALEQDRRSKKDAKMTPQTINNRKAPPMASELQGRVLRTMRSQKPKKQPQSPLDSCCVRSGFRACFGDGLSFGRLRVESFGCSRGFPLPGLVPKPSWEVQLMALEPGSQTPPLEQTGKSKKDAKMTTQTIDNREAPPRASGLRGRVLRTMSSQKPLQRPWSPQGSFC